MQTLSYERKGDAIRAIAIRLVLIVTAVAVSVVLLGSAAGVGHPRNERPPSFSAGPSICRLDAHRVPCS